MFDRMMFSWNQTGWIEFVGYSVSFGYYFSFFFQDNQWFQVLQYLSKGFYMLPIVSNVPTSNEGKKLSGVLRSSLDLVETQYYQTQYLSNNAVADCSGAGDTTINDFSVELAEASGTVLAGVKDKKARKDKKDTAGHASERSRLTKDQSLEHHGNKHKCDICGRAFEARYRLTRHKLVHTVSRDYECYICNKAFKTKDALVWHERLHLNIRNHLCQECGKAFSSKSKLTRHQSVHSKDRPFKCETCSRTYKNRDLLAQHQVSHSGKYLYVCEVCNRRFRRKQHLQSHMFVHSNEKPYKCLYCGKDLKSNRSLYQHIRRNHHRGSVVSQSRSVVEQPSTSSTHVDKSKTGKRDDKMLDYLRTVFPD